ncbi:UDP-N-acetylmuramoyl-L-alanine--D-glutamate ligase [uncultured Dialister sp.]|uniref:UDP-N-acetylmuramoyl-L-alanine--D-glutamate ligase n=1 Tax=uncultured Dialister sp. TaxID=278064 RepID=UPI0026066B36|nr:UDP-N-acetylmuramoyl-L-alanine--D-glutamate ligase [uncultured Dialister sp.]
MKSVLILGAGISGLGAAHVLLRHNVNVLISDLKDSIHDRKEKDALTELGASFRFGPQSLDLLDGVDTVVVSPVIPRENPVVAEAFKRHIDVISEVELAYRVTKAPILAITGTNGKTTTTTLLGSMVSKSGRPFALAGNLGISLSREAELVPADGVIAAEVSSFQLEFIKTFKPRAAVILNITPDHLERHHTMEAYVAAKARIFENMDKSDCLLLNAEDSYTPELKKQAETHTHVCLLSTRHEVEEGAFLDGDVLVIRRQGKEIPLLHTGEMKLKGMQNYEDALAASFLAYEGGVPVDVIISVLKDFTSLPNRIEYVRTLHDVEYYNDSKATNTDAAEKGMSAFGKPVILIAGGYDKGTPLEEFMAEVKKHTKHLILLGAAADRFEKAAKKAGVSSIHRVSSMKEAVITGQKLAEAGDIVILSPACSSFDMYHNMEERGMDFKRIVKSLT